MIAGTHTIAMHLRYAFQANHACRALPVAPHTHMGTSAVMAPIARTASRRGGT